MNGRLQKEKVKKIAVIKALMLGDLMVSIPAFRALRYAFPNAKIILVGLPWAKVFVQRFKKYLDGFLEFPPLFNSPERKKDKLKGEKLLEDIKKEHFDLILQMHGNGTLINAMLPKMGGIKNGGFYPQGHSSPNEAFFLLFPNEEIEIRKYLKLLEFLDIPAKGEFLEFPISEDDVKKFEKNSRRWNLSKNFICVHPGAQFKERRWGTQNFADIADYLASKGFHIVLTGVAKEKKITREVKELMFYPSFDLAGKTDLGQIGLLIKNAKLLISNDTGVTHIASALRTKSISVSFAENPYLWAPPNKKLHRVIPAQEAKDAGVILSNIKRLITL